MTLAEGTPAQRGTVRDLLRRLDARHRVVSPSNEVVGADPPETRRRLEALVELRRMGLLDRPEDELEPEDV